MSDEYGYGKPPKKNQFKKGQSGNYKGRPRKSARKAAQPDALSILREVMYRKVDATERGKMVKIPVLKAFINKMIVDALNGDPKTREQLIKMLERADLAAQQARTDEPLHIIVTGGLPDD